MMPTFNRIDECILSISQKYWVRSFCLNLSNSQLQCFTSWLDQNHLNNISDAIVSIPSNKFPNRIFSFSACWLLSWLAIDTVIVFPFSYFSKRKSGRVPPIVGCSTTWSLVVVFTASITFLIIGKSIDVRWALVPSLPVTFISF